MTRLGGALVLGVGVTVAALAFGSRPLGVAGIGLLFAALGARAWAGLVREDVRLTHVATPPTATEGDRVRVRLEVTRMSGVPVGSIAVEGTLGRLGPFECRLDAHGRLASAELALGRLPRGRFPLSDARVVLGDHLGLESVTLPVSSTGAALVVRPRVVELGGLFSDAGRHAADGRRLLLRRPAGFDLHSVREYEQGESLRRVHWPTTARRGQLMVKELEDAPRDAVVVLLDCDPAGAAGEPPDSSFDTAVRAAGSLLRAHVARGRRAALATTGLEPAAVSVCSLEGDFDAALVALASAEPDARYGLAHALSDEHGPAARAGELVVVTASLEPSAVEALIAVAARRLAAVVWVDAPSFAGRPTRAHPGALRLAALDVPLVVVRRGDDLAAALDRPRVEAMAHG